MALPEEDAAEVERRVVSIERELDPKSEMGRSLARRAAMLSVRLERCYRHEAASLGRASDSAVEACDFARRLEAHRLMDGLVGNPSANADLLRQTPEGVTLLIEAWQRLAEGLDGSGGGAWGSDHGVKAEALMGRRPGDLPRSRISELGEALMARSEDRPSGEAERARGEMLARIAGRVEGLVEFRANMDRAGIERARARAADLALFDASPGAILARKYEAATERSLFRTLREFQEVEGATEVKAGKVEVCGKLGPSLPAGPGRRLGSSLPEVRRDDPPPVKAEVRVEMALEEAIPEPPRRRPDPEKLRKQAAKRGRQARRG